MNIEQSEQIAFELILHAGNAKSNAMEAIYQMRENRDEEKAMRLIEESHKELQLAHQSQTSLLVEEAQGTHREVTILMVHAQDHLSMAISAIEYAEEIIHLYSLVYSLKQ